MKKHNNQDSRNFGYGKQLAYAGKQALNDRYGADGKFSTRASHAARFNQFAQWCKSDGINDARKITAEHIAAYASDLSNQVASGEKAVSYAQNQLSSVNVVLSTMRGNTALNVSPSKLVGERSHIRDTVPLSLERSNFDRALKLMPSGEGKLAVFLAREFGLRLREVGLFRPGEAFSRRLITMATLIFNAV
ncbi:hypothetical protein J8L98_13365 [Pseudoalteromonas sp. MMG013]|uniref:hypothetical protein n=1 Tax=Pseudoalteromonas sp. MMG013 TaxID=2822687 RepID=UPI001B376214|nr:hypothetical protein [Pseudoalteromonas sp. MMG013]MBQ4862679.1 hypothetical protein [Pseudoalteromonas sp. MMG013]